MSTVRKTISVTDQQNDWIKTQIARGDYANDSELIRTLIRDAQARQAHTEALREALRIGEESGVSERALDDIWRDAVRKTAQSA